ncbi:hypothetical protein [Streptomyces sp. NBC_00829]|uniref:hypothetical protein n=1 Tax=Streptomyces sp. NBC_00829 TaxID=2903679 RepID=UPI002F907F46|nr:hypothetical protein OG293_40050 [Streptomyces sp. NBC_00829]
MTFNDLLAVLGMVTALRVFAPDVRALTRRLLSAGVRMGAAGLLENVSRGTAAPAASRDEEL